MSNSFYEATIILESKPYKVPTEKAKRQSKDTVCAAKYHHSLLSTMYQELKKSHPTLHGEQEIRLLLVLGSGPPGPGIRTESKWEAGVLNLEV